MLTTVFIIVGTLIVASLKPVRKGVAQFMWGVREGKAAAEEGRKPNLQSMPTELRFGKQDAA